jgi:hypothetical protein
LQKSSGTKWCCELWLQRPDLLNVILHSAAARWPGDPAPHAVFFFNTGNKMIFPR